MDLQNLREKPQVQKADLSYSNVRYVREKGADRRVTDTAPSLKALLRIVYGRAAAALAPAVSDL
jgi:hypothetical protein